MISRRIKRSIAWMMACILLLAVSSGCSSVPGNSGTAKVQQLSLTAADLEQPQEGAFGLGELVQGANDFAFRLAKELFAEDSADSRVCSPFSIWLSMSALSMAAHEECREELMASLGLEDMTQEQMNHAMSQLLYILTYEEGAEWCEKNQVEFARPLTISNLIAADDSVILNREFAQDFLDFYRGEAIQLDLQARRSAEAVNQWVSEQTNHLIDQAVERFEGNDAAVLCSTLHFSDAWSGDEMESYPEQTKFNSPSGNVSAQYLCREDYLSCYEDDSLQAAELNLAYGAKLTLLLPKEASANELLASMDAKAFQQVSSQMQSLDAQVIFPEFSVSSGVFDCRKALEQMGVPLAQEGYDSLPGLTEGEGTLGLSKALQSAVFQADRQGVTGAAATISIVTSGVKPEEYRFAMNCNRPFVFVLSQPVTDRYDQVLFIGVVNQP